jgi:MFS family permease
MYSCTLELLILVSVYDFTGWDQEAVGWTLSGYPIAVPAIAPIIGSMSDLLSRRRFLLIGNATVVFGMILVGVTGVASLAIMGMLVVGIGSTISFIIGMAGIAELAPIQDRGKYFSAAAIILLPTAAIPVIGKYSFGRCSDIGFSYFDSNWRWSAFIPIIMGSSTFIMTALFYKPSPRPRTQGCKLSTIVRKIDFIGIVLLTSGLAMFVAAIIMDLETV